ncbi:MAG: hypothetical protein JSR54_14640 [Proteobacteria bacterium]|nr:hypothetical protein [Pseudomonadota bacterium]
MSTNCAAADESGRPELVRELARRVGARLSAPALAAAAAVDAGPRVRVVTNAVPDVVEEISAALLPFARLLVDDDVSVTADYVLTLDFQSSGGGHNLAGDSSATGAGRAFLAGLTLGTLVPYCHPTDYVLRAELVDARGVVRGRAQVARRVRTRPPDCRDLPDDRPDVAAGLVREAYRELRRERTGPWVQAPAAGPRG